MTTVLGFLSKKLPNWAKTTSQSASELRALLFSIALVTLGLEVFLLTLGDVYAQSTPELSHALSQSTPELSQVELSQALSQRSPFVFAFILFTLLLCALEYTFRPFVSSTAASLLPLLPTAILLALLHRIGSPAFFPPAVLTAAAARLFAALMPRKDQVQLYGIFLLDAIAVYLSLARHVLTGKFPTDKLLFIILTILTLSALQHLIGQKRDPFPFFYFALLGCVMLFLPMSPKPINWTPLVDTGQRLVRTVMNMTDQAAYYLSSGFDDNNYTTGYSSLDVGGGAIDHSSRTQLILTMAEKPYFTYTDAETEQKMRVRRTLYLAGGRGANKQQLKDYLNFLHASGVNREYARLFSKTSEVDVEYALIDTFDEIAPAGAFLLRAEKGADGTESGAGTNTLIESGTSATEHRKGYKLKTRYLDIDYGSPYLINLFKNAENSSDKADMTYQEACDYAYTLFGIELDAILTKEEYESLPKELTNSGSPYIDTTGSSNRMADLAASLTAGAANDYDKSKLIETYLRQFTYDLNASGGSNPQSNMTTPEGMSDIADHFLFETGKGYCVHYTSSMIMLLRLSGIPARAVSGYRYGFPLEEQDAYEVGGNCAHVWPEAYLSGIGWVPFEPTVIYRTASEFTWHRAASEEASASPAPATPELPSPPESDQNATFENATSGVAGSEASDSGLLSRLFRIILPVALSVLLLLFALIAGSNAIKKLRYAHASPEKKLQMDVEMVKKSILHNSYEDFTDRGLLSDYVARVPEALRPDIQKVFDIYYRVIYGNSGITSQESEFTRRVREQLSDIK